MERTGSECWLSTALGNGRIVGRALRLLLLVSALVLFVCFVVTETGTRGKSLVSYVRRSQESLYDTRNSSANNGHLKEPTSEAPLPENVRVLVWIMTGPQNLQSKASVVRDTWGRRANKLLFFSSRTNETFPTIGLNTKEGRAHLTAKTMQAFRHIYDHHFNDADWFMKADDDTYVIMENLRLFLSRHNTSEPVFFGSHFKKNVAQGYYSGGAGYVLSKEALRRYGEKGLDPKLCVRDGGSEDVAIARCMEKLGVKTANCTDSEGRILFHPFNPETHFFGNYPHWYYAYASHKPRKGFEAMSKHTVSFHYVSPKLMQLLELYFYYLRPSYAKGAPPDTRHHTQLRHPTQAQ